MILERVGVVHFGGAHRSRAENSSLDSDSDSTGFDFTRHGLVQVHFQYPVMGLTVVVVVGNGFLSLVDHNWKVEGGETE